MHDEQSNAEWLTFGVYTTLGYLALGLHRWIFAPGLEDSRTAVGALLVLVNLLAGSWCFVRALRAAWTVTH